MTPGGLAALCLGAAAVGLGAVFVAGRVGWLSPRAIGFVTAGLGLFA